MYRNRMLVYVTIQNRLFHTSEKLRNFAHDYLTSHEQKQSYVQCKSDLPLVYRTVGQHLQVAANKFPNNEAMISCHEGLRYTYAEVLDKTDRMAAAFFEIGLEKGDRVGIWAPNNAVYYLATLAAARAGMISVGINPAYQIPELEYALKKVDVKVLVMAESFRTRNYYESLKELVPELTRDNPGQLNCANIPSLASVIIDSERTYPGTFSVDHLLNLPSEQQISQIESIQPSICPDSGACLLYTSGTTGHPKAALISHFGLVNNASLGAYRNGLDSKDHRVCIQVPLFHAFGLAMGLVSCMNYGSAMVLPGPAFKASESLDAIIKEKCTVMYGTPTMYVDMLAEFRKRNVQMHQMELAMFGAAACSPKLMMDVQEMMGVRRVLAAYGMTETSCATFMCDRDDTTESAMGTVGRIFDHCEAKVVDRDGKIVPFGTPGELMIRGFGNMLGFWGDVQKTKEVIGSDQWLKTGDQFVLQPNGYGKVVGRIKELIIRGGENIYPKEIEDVLNRIPGILESHCIGVPDDRLGEEVCAYIRVDSSEEGNKVDMARIREFCKNKLAHFKIPKHVRVVEDLPKTTTGKIQKFKLFNMYMNENEKNKV